MTAKPHPLAPTAPSPWRPRLLIASGVAALAGLLFGYDTAVVSGAIGFLEVRFQLDAGLSGWVASVLLLGCAVGTVISGGAGHRFGRKPVLVATGLVFAVSALWSGMADSVTALATSRFLGGIAIGAASMLAPVYLAEIAPAEKRGRLVTLYQFGIVTGILSVFVVNWWIQNQGDFAWNVQTGWRFMFAALALPSVLFSLALFLVPESPRWLFQKGRKEEAERVIESLQGKQEASARREEWSQSVDQSTQPKASLLEHSLRRPLLIGILMAVFSQTSGINAVMYYAPEIFKTSGAQADDAFLQTIGVGAINLIFTLIAFSLVDQIGRRFLLILGTLLQFVALAGLATMFHFAAPAHLFLFPVLLFVAAFAMSTGAVTWIVLSEIFPNRIRSQAMSCSVAILWIADWGVTQTFPLLRENAGPAITFGLYATSSLLALVFTHYFLPETRGRSLEEIEKNWIKS